MLTLRLRYTPEILIKSKLRFCASTETLKGNKEMFYCHNMASLGNASGNFSVYCQSKNRRPQCDVNKIIESKSELNGLPATLTADRNTSSNLFPATGGVVVTTGDSIDGLTDLTLNSGPGGQDQVIINSFGTSAAAVRIVTSGAGGIDIDSGVGGITLNSPGIISLDASSITAGSNFTSVGAPGVDLTLNTTAGSLNLTGGEAAPDAVRILASAGAGGVDMDAGTGGITQDTTGGISLDSTSTTVGSNFTLVGGAGADLTLSSTSGSLNLLAGETVSDAIRIFASGVGSGIDIDTASGTFSVTTGANVASNITMISNSASLNAMTLGVLATSNIVQEVAAVARLTTGDLGITVGNAAVDSSHIVATDTALIAAITSGTITQTSLAGSDTAGLFTGTTAAAATDDTVSITFNSAYATAPHVVISPFGTATATSSARNQLFISAIGTTFFTVSIGAAVPVNAVNGASFTWNVIHGI